VCAVEDGAGSSLLNLLGCVDVDVDVDVTRSSQLVLLRVVVCGPLTLRIGLVQGWDGG
jgi:hypothetical protein